MEEPARSGRRKLWFGVGGAVGIIVLLLAGAYAVKLLSAKSDGPRKPPKLTLITPPPPPPPPPPKFEKKPDPPKEQKEMKVEQPVQKQESPPPSPELKMEGQAGDGPSAFAAGKVTSEDLSKLGTKGGTGTGERTGMFNPFNNYANLLKGEMQRYLNKNANLRKRRYTVEARVWVSNAGSLQRFELVGSTGDTETDDAVNQALAALQGFSQSPPANMPQPIRLRIVTSG